MSRFRQTIRGGVNKKNTAKFNTRDGGVRSNYIPELPDHLQEAYREFNANLSPSQRQALNLHSDANLTGEIKPLNKEDECVRLDDLDHPQDISRNQWLSPLAVADTPVDPDHLESPPPGFVHIIAVLAILRRALRVYEVSSQQDAAVRLHGDCIAIALGIPGFTTSDTARRHSVTKQAVSKRVKVITNALALPAAYRDNLAALPAGVCPSMVGSTRKDTPKPPTGTLGTKDATPRKQGVTGGCKESFSPPPRTGRRQQTHPKTGGRKV